MFGPTWGPLHQAQALCPLGRLWIPKHPGSYTSVTVEALWSRLGISWVNFEKISVITVSGWLQQSEVDGKHLIRLWGQQVTLGHQDLQLRTLGKDTLFTVLTSFFHLLVHPWPIKSLPYQLSVPFTAFMTMVLLKLM